MSPHGGCGRLAAIKPLIREMPLGGSVTFRREFSSHNRLCFTPISWQSVRSKPSLRRNKRHPRRSTSARRRSNPCFRRSTSWRLCSSPAWHRPHSKPISQCSRPASWHSSLPLQRRASWRSKPSPSQRPASLCHSTPWLRCSRPSRQCSTLEKRSNRLASHRNTSGPFHSNPTWHPLRNKRSWECNRRAWRNSSPWPAPHPKPLRLAAHPERGTNQQTVS